MKRLSLLFCFIHLFCFPQEKVDLLSRDTVQFQDFFSNVDHLELCELKPFLKIRSVRKKGIFRTKIISTDTLYSTLSALDGNDSINLNIIGNRCLADNGLTKEVQSIILHKTYENEYEIMCYEPRNCILFFNSNNEMIGYMELCFECQHNIGLFIPKMDLNSDQFKSLKKIFLREGLKVMY